MDKPSLEGYFILCEDSREFHKNFKMVQHPLENFAPVFSPDPYSDEDTRHLSPFFTNLDKPVYVPLIFAPELIGALCSRTSRAAQDLRHIYLHEFIYPFVNPVRDSKETDDQWTEKARYGEDLKSFIVFLQKHSILDLFSNPRARSFYIKWLAQYGDDSIAQMAGTHLVFSGISQVAIKHFEDQRIGLAPIEKSTRYVNYAQRVNGRYLYYADPTLRDLGLEEEYRAACDGLFETYAALLPRLTTWLLGRFPEERPSVVEKKAFDTLRGLLPTSTLSQVAFFGNGQAFEHMISRSLRHPLGEIRWAAEAAYAELAKVTPSFLRRIKDEEKKELVAEYQQYLAEKGRRVDPLVKKLSGNNPIVAEGKSEVRLVDFDPEGETKVLAAVLYSSPRNHLPWQELYERVQDMATEEKRKIIGSYLEGRTQRWQKVGRAFEHASVQFEIVMNIGAWRDLHRHRMLTQARQNFSCHHGFEVPQEIMDAGLTQDFSGAIQRAEDVYAKIAHHDPDLAQYAVTLAHRLRFIQRENMRQSFWQIELRTIPEGHPDYRRVCQQKFKLLEPVYPLLLEHMRANMGEYDFARRGQEEKIQQKLARLS